MEEDLQELIIATKHHVCKFCSKSFPCGRSLGGHMRSHVTANLSSSPSEADNNEKEINPMMMNPSSSSHEEAAATTNNNNNNTGYGLRENPKKTWRIIADNSASEEDASLFLIHDEKLCKECGKSFTSCKALFGHMKCHSNNNSFLEDQDSCTMKQLVMDSQSDNEATAPSRRRRSKRRTRRYNMVGSASASSSYSLSEVEQEQEEVAMSLIMLSRDVGNWSGLQSVAESSDNNFGHCFEVRCSSSVRTNLVTRIDSKMKHTLSGSEVGKLSNSVSKGKSSELFAATELPENGFRMKKKTEFSINELKFIKSETALDDSEAEIGKIRVNGTEPGLSKSVTSNKHSSIKAKFLDSDQLKSNSLNNKNSVKRASEGEFRKNSHNHKKGKFECTTCNRIFHSYQALGGHRASHKKIKGCFASWNDHHHSSDNSIDETETETETEKNSVVDSEILVENNEVEAGSGSGFGNELGTTTTTTTTATPSKSKVHECPICFKVFASGQALGGHKRSHMSGAGGGPSEIRNCQRILIQESVPEIRDFLDLNLPASAF